MTEPTVTEHAELDVQAQHQAAAIAADARGADGAAPLSEQGLAALAGTAPQVTHFVVTVAGDDDTMAGYANVVAGRDGEPAMAELVVAPAQRRAGRGRALVDAVLASTTPVRIWAHGDLDAARALAASARLSRERVLLQLRRGLTDLPELTELDGVSLRTYAGAEDDAEILRVNNAAFDWHPEQGGWTSEEVARRTAAGWFDPAGLFLAFDHSDPRRLLGFHWTKVHPSEDPSRSPELGEVYVVGVDPAAQGRGLGRYLTLAGLHHLAGIVGECELYVEGDNAAALHTYEKLGFSQYAIDVAYGR